MINPLTRVENGQLYDANYDQTLLDLRTEAKKACHFYNQSAREDRSTLLKNILGGIGKNICIEPPFFCDYGANIYVGDNFYANHGLIILDGAEVRIGDNVFIGPQVGLHTAGHPLDPLRRNQGLEYVKPITLCDNVWIGANCTILPGITIHEGAVIGAGSVVTKDVPANVVAVGNPCRVLRKITEQDATRCNF